MEQEHPDVRLFEILGVRQLFDNSDGDVLPYTYEETWNAAIDNPILTICTSGTTGLPKLITYRNRTFTCFDSQYELGLSGRPLAINHFKQKRVWSSLSMAHLGGIYTNIVHPVYFHTVPVLGPPNGPLTAELCDQLILYDNISTGFYPPSLLDEIVTRPKSLHNLFNLDTVQYGTAPLNRATAQSIVGKVPVQPHYATTESSFPPYFSPGPEDWEYFSFHPFAGFEFCHRHDNFFELLILRKEEYIEFQPVFTTMQDASYFIQKIYGARILVPTKPSLWKYCGRTDDHIILSNSVHILPTSVESAIQEHPHVRAALVGGQGRTGPYLLVESVTHGNKSGSSEDLLNELWPSFQAANERLIFLKEGWITKERVIVAPETRPFARLVKGSVDRTSTIKDFEQDIENCYSCSN